MLSAPPRAGILTAAGNALSSCLLPMTLDTQMTLVLLQELMMALQANDAERYEGWLVLGIEQLGRKVAGEVESEEMMQVVFCEGGV